MIIDYRGELMLKMVEKTKQKHLTDTDKIDTLSLSVVPLTSNTLRNARLIKNSRMETAVELHHDPISGSLLLKPEDIAQTFAGAERDQEIIAALAALNSYDVYSMRTSFKKLGIQVQDSSLSLSETMKLALNQYAIEFIRPLLERIFGDDPDHSDISGASLEKILRDSDPAKVKKNLQTITERTGIPVDEIPTFIENYSDVFLSVAYYRHYFESIGTDIDRFLLWIKDLQKYRDVTSSPQTFTSCKKVEHSLRVVSASIRERLGKFQANFEAFWGNINKSSFDNLRKQIENNHTSMGSVLCGLVVKMQNWTHEFPDNTVGGPQKRAQFIMTEMEPGMEKLRLLENEARKQINMPIH